MSDVSVLTLAVLHRVAEFIQELPEEQLADLAEGRARLSYIPWGESEPVRPKAARKVAVKKAAPKLDTAAVVAALEQAADRDEGQALLGPLAVGELRAVAMAAGMTGVSKTGKQDLIDQIVALTIGGRMSFAAMHTM